MVAGIHAEEIDQVGGSFGVGVDVGVAAVRAVVGAAGAVGAVLRERPPGGIDSAGPAASLHVNNDLLNEVEKGRLKIWSLRRKATENIHMVLRSRWYK